MKNLKSFLGLTMLFLVFLSSCAKEEIAVQDAEVDAIRPPELVPYTIDPVGTTILPSLPLTFEYCSCDAMAQHGDFNDDGVIDQADVDYLIDVYVNNDYDGNQFVNIEDFFYGYNNNESPNNVEINDAVIANYFYFDGALEDGLSSLQLGCFQAYIHDSFPCPD